MSNATDTKITPEMINAVMGKIAAEHPDLGDVELVELSVACLKACAPHTTEQAVATGLSVALPVVSFALSASMWANILACTAPILTMAVCAKENGEAEWAEAGRRAKQATRKGWSWTRNLFTKKD